jgi:hypothetical protein
MLYGTMSKAAFLDDCWTRLVRKYEVIVLGEAATPARDSKPVVSPLFLRIATNPDLSRKSFHQLHHASAQSTIHNAQLGYIKIAHQFGLAPVPLITVRSRRIDCSRSRNSSVTALASTLLRMSRVLIKTMISDLVLVPDVFPSKSPINLISRRPGMPD